VLGLLDFAPTELVDELLSRDSTETAGDVASLFAAAVRDDAGAEGSDRRFVGLVSPRFIAFS
ncbi:MAG: hypothetical protein M3Y27_12350, partial [Acidobacteriota bacterium]|nr:hypothetical protein [Acidobacteriota bacterium]